MGNHSQTVKQVAHEAYADNKELEELVARAIELFLKRNGVDIADGKLIIPRNYMIDTSYSIMWSPKDFDSIVSKLINKIHLGTLYADEYFRYLQRIYNDQSVVLDKNITLEPIDIGRKYDRVTFEGVRDIFLNWMGIPQQPISHGMVGEGIGLPSYGQQSLFKEVSRQPIKQANNGSISLRGETLFINASFSSGVVGFVMREAGTANSGDPANDKMQIYIQFDGIDQKTHVQNNTVPQFSTSVSVCTL